MRVFPAHAGVFLKKEDLQAMINGFPRTRGGVSSRNFPPQLSQKFSPHTRGCFYIYFSDKGLEKVFPAHAGVFLRISSPAARREGFPRTRGGVSITKAMIQIGYQFSPHTRGCFLHKPNIITIGFVFPAHAGVFLRQRTPSRPGCSFPRTRGGVSRVQAKQSEV